jgi:transcriptional antiterminator RfaH
MPLLPAEPTWFPDALFTEASPASSAGRLWRVLHTKPRQEKCLSRQFLEAKIPFYLPLLSRRLMVRGRAMTSYVPLFPGYVFLLGTIEERLRALATGRVVQTLEVADQPGLEKDLLQLWRLLASGMPVHPEDRLVPGATVEIIDGPLAGLSGKVVRAASGRRFVVEVHFIQRGASVLLDDFVLKAVNAVQELNRSLS